MSACPKCGASLPEKGWEGLCPKCLVRVSRTSLLARYARITAEPSQPGSSQRSWPVEGCQGRLFGDFELLEEVGRGGMGVVYRARQISLNRTVAVKMILAGELASAAEMGWMGIEAAIAGQLQHPNIVAVRATGTQDGQPFIAMDFVEGEDLAQIVGRRPLAPDQATRYVKTIAWAVHYAHEQGILHRDLKPSNVLIDANDAPRVTDFGLAKRLRGKSSLAVTGRVVGSPGFIPPEQAGARRASMGWYSDVYALGGILYYLLTARAPSQGETLEATLYQVLNREPISPRLLNSSVPRDLETICLKCLEKEPARRYQTAQELANELEHFLRDEPIQARPTGRPEKFWRWCRHWGKMRWSGRIDRPGPEECGPPPATL